MHTPPATTEVPQYTTRWSNLSITRLVAVFASGNLLATFLRMLGGLLTARMVEPATLGLFNGLGLVLGYAPFLLLGISTGLNRELPFFIGRGEKDQAHQLASAAQGWILSIIGLLSLFFGGLAIYHGLQMDWQLAAGWLTQIFMAFSVMYGTYYLNTTFRTHSDFAKLSVVNVIQNALGILALPLVWLFGFYGLCLRSITIAVAGLQMLWRWRPVKVRPSWDWAALKHLFKIGIPIFITGQLFAWWSVLNLTLVLYFMGTEGLGLYQVANLAKTAAMTLPLAISQVVYPRMVETYGDKGKLNDVLNVPRQIILLGLLAAIPVTILGWLLIPWVVNFLLPSYAAGILAAQWTLVATAILYLHPLNNAFNVVKRQDLFATTILLGMAANAISLFLIGQSGFSLESFPQAMVIGRIVYIVTSYSFLWYLSKRDSQSEIKG